jgi:hypothetical protein
VGIHCRFNILAPLVADFISADYPYLRQLTECAADLAIGSLEDVPATYQPPFTALHRVRSSDHQWRSSEKEAMASRFNDAAVRVERALVRIDGSAPEVAER